MTNNQFTDEELQTLIIELQQTAYRLNGTNSAYLMSDAIKPLRELQERRNAAMGSEPVVWINGCNKSVPAALRYLAENPQPIGGESSFNTAHLYQMAREIELMAEATLYRHAQQPVVPFGLHPDTQKLVIDFCTAPLRSCTRPN